MGSKSVEAQQDAAADHTIEAAEAHRRRERAPRRAGNVYRSREHGRSRISKGRVRPRIAPCWSRR